MKEMLSNKILTGLPAEDFGRLVTVLEPASLSAGETLCGPGERARFVYFPEGAVLSWHAEMQDGKSAEVGMVGSEGAAGLAPLFGTLRSAHSLAVLSGGSALRVRAEDFERELRRSDALRRSLLAYAGEHFSQVGQRSACGVLHKAEQRLAVWLLMLTERLGSDEVEITQERIAQHLGVRRAGVTVIVGGLQQMGILGSARGSLRVLDRSALESVACECYAMIGARGAGGVPSGSLPH